MWWSKRCAGGFRRENAAPAAGREDLRTAGVCTHARRRSGYSLARRLTLWCFSSFASSATSGLPSRVRVVTYRSFAPTPPGRAEKKYSVVPSKESAGAPSKETLLTVGPKFTGADHGSAVVARVETHKSWPPTPPDRPVASEEMNSSRPPRRIAVRVSRYGPLSSVPSPPGPQGSSSPARVLT